MGQTQENLKAREERMEFAVKLLSETGGKRTPELDALWFEKFGDKYIPTPVVVGAQERLGLRAKRVLGPRGQHKPPAPQVTKELSEALNIVAHVDKIQREINELDHKIDTLNQAKSKLKVELEQYAPVLGSMRALQHAVNKVRASAGGEA